MAQQKIELRKIRDFGENISDSLQFIRQEFKPLLTSFLAFAGVFILGYGIFSGMYQSKTWGMLFARNRSGYNQSLEYLNNTSSYYKSILWYYLALFVFLTLNNAAMQTSLASYFKVYDAKRGESPTLEEVWQQFRQYFFKVLLYSIVINLLILVGCVFCILPGIYFLVVLAPFNIILIIEDFSFRDAFDKCFRIIKENFWLSLGIYFVAYLIYAFGSSIIGVILGGITGLGSYLTTKNVSQTAGLAAGVLSVVKYLFYLILFTAIGLNYFSLTEKVDGEGLLRRIENLGNTSINTEEEQY